MKTSRFTQSRADNAAADVRRARIVKRELLTRKIPGRAYQIGIRKSFEIFTKDRRFFQFLRRGGHRLGTLRKSLQRSRRSNKIFCSALFFRHCSVKMLNPEGPLAAFRILSDPSYNH